MANSEGFSKYLRPWLEVKLNQSFPKVSEFEDDEKFLYAAKGASMMKQVIAEILMYVEGKKMAYEDLEEKRSGKVKNKTFKI